MRSYVNVKSPNLKRHPAFKHIQGYRCIVKAGETLVIPSRYWHQVFYHGASWGLAFRKYALRSLPETIYNCCFKKAWTAF